MVGPGLVGEPKSGTEEGGSQLGYQLLSRVGIRTESPRDICRAPARPLRIIFRSSDGCARYGKGLVDAINGAGWNLFVNPLGRELNLGVSLGPSIDSRIRQRLLARFVNAYLRPCLNEAQR